MKNVSRREFLGSTLAAAGTVALSHTKSSGRILGANDTIRVAVAGLNGRGGIARRRVSRHEGRRDRLPHRPGHPHLQEAPRQDRREERRQAGLHRQDVRKALEDKNLDAVSIATPNHWHALMTIWACQAGKDVYVEKPCSHNVHEGRVAVEAARKHDRIVQHGTQSRSEQGVGEARRGRRSPASSASCWSATASATSRATASATKPTAPPPKEVDFNIWLGPATEQPYHANLVHYNWHWFWDFGNGDIGNQGVHQMDIARWMIPGATLPKIGRSASAAGSATRTRARRRTRRSPCSTSGETQLDLRGPRAEDRRVPRPDGRQHPALRGRGRRRRQVLPERQADEASRCRRSRLPARGPGDNFGNFIHAVRSRKRDGPARRHPRGALLQRPVPPGEHLLPARGGRAVRRWDLQDRRGGDRRRGGRADGGPPEGERGRSRRGEAARSVG